MGHSLMGFLANQHGYLLSVSIATGSSQRIVAA